MKTFESYLVNTAGAFPNTTAINATGPGTTDGTEFIAEYLNDAIFGVNQAVIDYANITPSGATEVAGASQFVEAYKKGFTEGPGIIKMWMLNSTPTALGYRSLDLNGQGILRASYVDLDSVAYVGDGNNAAVAAAGGAFYRADDAAGTVPNIIGIYLILPETRGYAPRGIDLAATIDPLGAARKLGDNQLDTFQGHHHGVEARSSAEGIFGAGSLKGDVGAADTTIFAPATTITTDGVNGTPRISSETRMVNFSTKFVITY